MYKINVAADNGEDATYDVYFIEDGQTSELVTCAEIRKCPPPSGDSFWATTVPNFKGQTFTHDGKGEVRVKGTFTIGELGTGDNSHKYNCTRAAEGRKKEMSKWIPVHKVVMALKSEREKNREM